MINNSVYEKVTAIEIDKTQIFRNEIKCFPTNNNTPLIIKEIIRLNKNNRHEYCNIIWSFDFQVPLFYKALFCLIFEHLQLPVLRIDCENFLYSFNIDQRFFFNQRQL